MQNFSKLEYCCFALGGGWKGNSTHIYSYIHLNYVVSWPVTAWIRTNYATITKKKKVGCGQVIGNMEDGGLGPCRIIKIPHSLRPWPRAAEFCSQVRARNYITKLDGSWEKRNMPCSPCNFFYSMKDNAKVGALVTKSELNAAISACFVCLFMNVFINPTWDDFLGCAVTGLPSFQPVAEQPKLWQTSATTRSRNSPQIEQVSLNL